MVVIWRYGDLACSLLSLCFCFCSFLFFSFFVFDFVFASSSASSSSATCSLAVVKSDLMSLKNGLMKMTLLLLLLLIGFLVDLMDCLFSFGESPCGY